MSGRLGNVDLLRVVHTWVWMWMCACEREGSYHLLICIIFLTVLQRSLMSLIKTVLPVWSLDTYQGIMITKKSFSYTLLRNILMYRSSFRFPYPNCQCDGKKKRNNKMLRDVFDLILLVVIISGVRYNSGNYSNPELFCSLVLFLYCQISTSVRFLGCASMLNVWTPREATGAHVSLDTCWTLRAVSVSVSYTSHT